MKGKFVAETRIAINASVGAVWQALTDPKLVKRYMHGTDMETDWKAGSPITWRGEYNGKRYEDRPENYHTVTYELAEQVGATTLTLKQDNNASQDEADRMAENNWAPVLEGLREVVEKQPVDRKE